MTLTKNKMIREIGRRTRLKNRDVQVMLETLVDIWTENIVAGERIELENFFVLEVKMIDRGQNTGDLTTGANKRQAPRYVKILNLRTSKHLKSKLKTGSSE
jgi:nucleoid DNA-binding protein